MFDCCKQEQIDQAGSDTEKCNLAHEWRKCLEGMMSPPCSIKSEDFPQKLDIAENTYCKGEGFPLCDHSNHLQIYFHE